MKIRITCLLLAYLSIVNIDAQSIELDKKLGAENAKAIELEMGIYNSEELTQYVTMLGDKLIAQLENPLFEYQFFVVDDPIPNAFATPGGYIYITRGILSIIVTEDELACVMAHEIIHAQNRHSIKQLRNSILPKLLELPGRIVGEVINEELGNLLTAPIATSNSLLLASYSRSHETESDTEGVTLASKAGYDPNAMKSILTRLSKSMEILTDQKETKGYFNDHPYTPDRLANITEVSDDLRWKKSAHIAKDFPQPLDKLLFGASPDQGFFENNTFMHPEMNISFHFPDNWETENQPSSVIGMNKEQNAALVLSLEDASKTPQDLAMAFSKGIEQQYKTKPLSSDVYTVNGSDGYYISYIDNTDDEEMYIHILWVKLNNQVFRFIGTGPKAIEPDLKESILSFHSLSEEEKGTITQKVIRVVKANRGESIEQLCARNNSIIDADLIAFVNGIEPKHTLKKGDLIKVIVSEKYY